MPPPRRRRGGRRPRAHRPRRKDLPMSRPKQIYLSLALFLALAIGTVAPSSAAVPLPGPCVADNTADSGAGSLREMVDNHFCASISFNLQQVGAVEILLLSPLVIDRNLAITGLGA